MDFNKVLFTFIRVAFSIMVILLIVFCGVKLCTVGYDFGYRVFTEPAVAAEGKGRDVVVNITSDMSQKQLANLLEDKGLVEDANLFYLQLKLSAYARKIKAGDYVLNTSMTAKEMMVIMSGSDKTDGTEDDSSGRQAVLEEGTSEVEQ